MLCLKDTICGALIETSIRSYVLTIFNLATKLNFGSASSHYEIAILQGCGQSGSAIVPTSGGDVPLKLSLKYHFHDNKSNLDTTYPSTSLVSLLSWRC